MASMGLTISELTGCVLDRCKEKGHNLNMVTMALREARGTGIHRRYHNRILELA